ncbi:UPF0488 protein CG14286 isoform X2 [Bacillus rossius redtenbacheri]|uniref:UPF0488 protein CG14286 isoform X2 n=1 Tax=Bacillus rossius redtenbacheri TaxID=93214 RepID=UPI002FDE541C
MSKNYNAAGGAKKPADSAMLPPIALSSEAAEQFELELCWCVQQLESALSSKKLNTKQAKETSRAANILKSNTASVVRKRQVMNVTFGDYRAKMAEEEKKFEKAPFRVKFDSKPGSGKSRFVKQCSTKLFNTSDKNFRFNFSCEEDSGENSAQCEKDRLSPSFKYQPSDNAFRFNFGDEVEQNVT